MSEPWTPESICVSVWVGPSAIVLVVWIVALWFATGPMVMGERDASIGKDGEGEWWYEWGRPGVVLTGSIVGVLGVLWRAQRILDNKQSQL